VHAEQEKEMNEDLAMRVYRACTGRVQYFLLLLGFFNNARFLGSDGAGSIRAMCFVARDTAKAAGEFNAMGSDYRPTHPPTGSTPPTLAGLVIRAAAAPSASATTARARQSRASFPEGRRA